MTTSKLQLKNLHKTDITICSGQFKWLSHKPKHSKCSQELTFVNGKKAIATFNQGCFGSSKSHAL